MAHRSQSDWEQVIGAKNKDATESLRFRHAVPTKSAPLLFRCRLSYQYTLITAAIPDHVLGIPETDDIRKSPSISLKLLPHGTRHLWPSYEHAAFSILDVDFENLRATDWTSPIQHMHGHYHALVSTNFNSGTRRSKLPETTRVSVREGEGVRDIGIAASNIVNIICQRNFRCRQQREEQYIAKHAGYPLDCAQ